MFKDRTPPSVLVVDDDPKICKVVKTFLDKSGYFSSVITAENVSVAILKTKNQNFDLIIVDYHMPNKNGTELVDLMMKSTLKTKPRFVLISGFLDANAMSIALKAGVKHILIKPFNKQSLFEKVKAALK